MSQQPVQPSTTSGYFVAQKAATVAKKWRTVQQHARAIARRDGGWACHYCGVALAPDDLDVPTGYSVRVGGYSYNEYYQAALVDHIVAKTKGGGHDLSNLVLACATCNARKGNRDYYDFVDMMGRWLEAYGHTIPQMPVYREQS